MGKTERLRRVGARREETHLKSDPRQRGRALVRVQQGLTKNEVTEAARGGGVLVRNGFPSARDSNAGLVAVG